MGRIFILEDEQSVNRGISFSLDKAGHQTCACYTMQEAKERLLQFKPDLVICDINLPDGSGLDFIEWLRGAPGCLYYLPDCIKSGDGSGAGL